MEKTPVNIISGFLGSGKTTAIIKLLHQKTEDENWAVIINEFGKVSIDGQTLQSSSRAGTVFDISGGCICCSARVYFQENLEKIIQLGNYQRIIIEPSGLGGIDMITAIVVTIPELQLMPAICLVDITAVENPRLIINMIYRSQIAKADIIVFSKCDLLADPETLNRMENQFKSAFPEKRSYLLEAELSPAKFQAYSCDAKKKFNCHRDFASHANLTDEKYYEKHFLFSNNQFFDASKLKRFFKEHSQIIRSKGHIQTEDGWKLINYTLSGCVFELCNPKNQGELVIIAEKSEYDQFPDFKKKIESLLI